MFNGCIVLDIDENDILLDNLLLDEVDLLKNANVFQEPPTSEDIAASGSHGIYLRSCTYVPESCVLVPAESTRPRETHSVAEMTENHHVTGKKSLLNPLKFIL